MKKFTSSDIEYHVLEFLGEGGCSEVYRAKRHLTDIGVDQELALKILKSETLVDIWRNEFKEFQGLQSPHLLRILGFDKVEGRPALLLEYIRGISLTELLKRKNVDLPLRHEILAQIRLGLQDLHQLSKCHGDLNPNNILIEDTGRVVLTDFLGQVAGFGTADFTSPLVLAGDIPSMQTDLFSLKKIAEWLGIKTNSQELSNAKLKERLGACIHELIDAYQNQVALTQPLKQGNSSIKIASLFLSAISALLLTGSTAFSVLRSDYRLEIITERWVELAINNENFGYTPVLFISTKPKIKIHWRAQDAEGEKTFILRPGEHRRIHDEELFSLPTQPVLDKPSEGENP